VCEQRTGGNKKKETGWVVTFTFDSVLIAAAAGGRIEADNKKRRRNKM
jgi:hypothetical protein